MVAEGIVSICCFWSSLWWVQLKASLPKIKKINHRTTCLNFSQTTVTVKVNKLHLECHLTDILFTNAEEPSAKDSVSMERQNLFKLEWLICDFFAIMCSLPLPCSKPRHFKHGRLCDRDEVVEVDNSLVEHEAQNGNTCYHWLKCHIAHFSEVEEKDGWQNTVTFIYLHCSYSKRFCFQSFFGCCSCQPDKRLMQLRSQQ